MRGSVGAVPGISSRRKRLTQDKMGCQIRKSKIKMIEIMAATPAIIAWVLPSLIATAMYDPTPES